MSKNAVTLKSGSGVTQGHVIHHLTDYVWFPISDLLKLCP